MRLRPAVRDDVPLLKEWDNHDHVRAAYGGDAWYDWEREIPRMENWGEILIAEKDGPPIGVIDIIDPSKEPSQYWGKVGPGYRAIDIWIGEASNLGRGYGSQMMTLALDRCFESPIVHEILIDPLDRNHRAKRFYERLGFTFVELRKFDTENCAIYRLDRSTYFARKS